MSNLDSFFNPKSIAVIGANNNPDDIGFLILDSLKTTFINKIYPINPNFSEILGLNCFPSVLDVKEEIDLALIYAKKEDVKGIVSECIKKKIPSAIILLTLNNDIWTKEDSLMIKNVSKGKIRIIGPNSLGIFKNNMDMIYVSRKRLKRPPEGYTTFLTDSGTFGLALLDILATKSIGVSKLISLGSKCDVNEIEMLEYLEKDLNTRCIAIYTESIENGRNLIDLAKKIIKKKPIVILKGIKTDAESIKSFDAEKEIKDSVVYSSLFKQANIIEASSVRDFVEFSKALANQPFLDSKNIAILSNCEGFASIAALSSIRSGFKIHEISKELKGRLKKALPDLDITTNLVSLPIETSPEKYEAALNTLLKDKEISGVVCISLMQPQSTDDDMVTVMREAKVFGKPILFCLSGGQYSVDRAKKLESYGIPVYTTPERAIKSMNTLFKYGEILKSK